MCGILTGCTCAFMTRLVLHCRPFNLMQACLRAQPHCFEIACGMPDAFNDPAAAPGSHTSNPASPAAHRRGAHLQRQVARVAVQHAFTRHSSFLWAVRQGGQLTHHGGVTYGWGSFALCWILVVCACLQLCHCSRVACSSEELLWWQSDVRPVQIIGLRHPWLHCTLAVGCSASTRAPFRSSVQTPLCNLCAPSMMLA